MKKSSQDILKTLDSLSKHVSFVGRICKTILLGRQISIVQRSVRPQNAHLRPLMLFIHRMIYSVVGTSVAFVGISQSPIKKTKKTEKARYL